MNAQVLRCCRHLAAVCVLLLIAGCRILPPASPIEAFEYRYRVFQAGQPLPTTMEAPLPLQVLTERTLPAGALNHSMDQLSKEGFKLHDIEQIPETGYYIFNFRKPVIDRYLPTQAPMEFTGVYRPATSGHMMVYYAFTPKYPGYTVTLFGRGELPTVLQAEWTGKMLRAQQGQTRFSFVIAGDGRTVTAIEETPLKGELQRNVVTLERMEK